MSDTPGPNPAGALRITLSADATGGYAVDLRSSRRTDLFARLFTGVPVETLLARVPTVFSVCGTAQACAAVRACEQATGVRAAARVEAARDILVLVETAREHLVRVHAGWNVWLGRPPDALALRPLGSLLRDWQQVLFPGGGAFRAGGAEPAGDRAALDELAGELRGLLAGLSGPAERDGPVASYPGRLAAWAAAGGNVARDLVGTVINAGLAGAGVSDVRVLPALPRARLDAQLAGPSADTFVARPTWKGVCCETGAYARQCEDALVQSVVAQHGNGLLARLVARLVELDAIPGRIESLRGVLSGEGAGGDVAPVLPSGRQRGTGMARVEAARGLLVHRVAIENGTVRAHRILAPTEWNFHPQGVLASALAGLSPGPDAGRVARLLIEAIDPCVEYHLEVREDA